MSKEEQFFSAAAAENILWWKQKRNEPQQKFSELVALTLKEKKILSSEERLFLLRYF